MTGWGDSWVNKSACSVSVKTCVLLWVPCQKWDTGVYNPSIGVQTGGSQSWPASLKQPASVQQETPSKAESDKDTWGPALVSAGVHRHTCMLVCTRHPCNIHVCSHVPRGQSYFKSEGDKDILMWTWEMTQGVIWTWGYSAILWTKKMC